MLSAELVQRVVKVNVAYLSFQPMTHVVAKNLVKQLNIQKPVILSMALKDNTPKTVKAIAEIIPSIL